MQLTESEKREIEKAKKISARWHKTRWIALFFSVAIIVAIVIFLCNGSMFSIGIACGFAGYVSFRNLVVIFNSWNGSAPYKLIVKLSEETGNPAAAGKS